MRASVVSEEPQSGYLEPTWILEVIMCSCVLQVSLKSNNLDRTNLNTGGYHVFLLASVVSEKPQPGYSGPTWILEVIMCSCVLQLFLKNQNLDIQDQPGY
jgi:hypothetical protein